ncbi:glutathione S-transferase family protein [Pleurocapsales cyanobacterium LEGE 06147]|nr:glutathione S-transferase family protein [Pleurocapsales cyanobacterium LEGE 06147]
MLQFYYTRLSINARRVWVTLLEKNLEFEPIVMKLNGDQFHPDFLKINPFHHIPVLIDDGFTVIESLAILDYLEAKYPNPSFLPTEAKDLAKVRMIELITVNELPPASIILMRQMLELEVEDKKIEQAKQAMAKALKFFEDNLADNSPYFIGEQFTYADIVAGTAVPSMPLLGVSLDEYPKIKSWCDRLQQRKSWQQTKPTAEEIEASKAIMKAIWQRR